MLEVTTINLQGKYRLEIKIESVNKDNFHSWVRISHGLKKLVTDLSNKEDDDNEQETSEIKFEEFALKSNARVLQADQRLKQNHKDVLLSAHPQKLFPLEKESGLMLSQKIIRQSITQCQKQLSTLLRHGNLPREEDGAIEFWRLKDYLRNEFENSRYWSDEMWKSKMAGGGGNNKRFQYCTDSSGQEILYLRALQGHSGRNPIDPSLQDKVLIPDNFFDYIYHVGCAINLHSITNSGLILGGQYLSKRQTVFFTSVDPYEQRTQRSK